MSPLIAFTLNTCVGAHTVWLALARGLQHCEVAPLGLRFARRDGVSAIIALTAQDLSTVGESWPAL